MTVDMARSMDRKGSYLAEEEGDHTESEKRRGLDCGDEHGEQRGWSRNVGTRDLLPVRRSGPQ